MPDDVVEQLLARVGIEPPEDELLVLKESFARMRSILDRMYETELAGDVSRSAGLPAPIEAPIDWLDSAGKLGDQQQP